MEVKKKKVKVVMLPAKGSSRDINIPILSPSGKLAYISRDDGGIRQGFFRADEFHMGASFVENGSENWTPQHLYFISDDEIKVGDYLFNNQGVHKCIDIKKGNYPFKIKNTYSGEVQWVWKTSKKVIATTDKSLNLPKPSQSFVQKYVEKDGIDEVMVEYIPDLYHLGSETPSTWKLKVNKHNEISISSIKNSWNREEIEALCRKAWNDGNDTGRNACLGAIDDNESSEWDWIEKYL